jgi:hypothetical protein
MVSLNVITIVESSTDSHATIQETTFLKATDLCVLPRIGETIILSNYLLEVVDVHHIPMAMPRVYCALDIDVEGMLTADQLASVSRFMLDAGWSIINSEIRGKTDEELAESRRLN